MTYLLQILEKHRWFAVGGVLLSALAIFCFGVVALFWQNESLTAAQTGFFNWQNTDFEGFSPAAVFFLLAAATLISEDLTCISAGVLVSRGKIGLAEAITACAVGIVLGDILIFLAGRYLGRRVLKWKITSYFLTEKAFEKSSAWLAEKGMKTVFISRFVFGLRLPLYFAAGVLKTSFWRFALYFSLAVAVWTPLVVTLTYKIGAETVKNSLFNQNLGLGLILLAALLYFFIRFLQKLTTWKGRRLLWGGIKRRFIWEFWSIRVFYLPVVAYIAYLGIRFRSLTVFSCANPSILAGGFVGESKNAILNDLKKSEAAAPFVLKHLFLPKELSVEEKLERARQFMTENDLTFPVVFKPDVGERGFGVRIFKNDFELSGQLQLSDDDSILQEFAVGDETSVFYYRCPRAKSGAIFAVTEKRFPHVEGDGAATLEELILSDGRAVCLAKSYLERNRERLETIPEKGEKVQIIDIGTHSRGAIFLDGGWMKTPPLERKIDEICRGYEGFYFGRFDIRTRSFEDFARAENFKIVELNGVTSEATSIYDPRNSLVAAYKTLFRQWRIAFEIGAQNRKLGASPTSVKDLIKLFLKSKEIQNPKPQI